MSKLVRLELYRFFKNTKNRVILVIILVYPFLLFAWLEHQSGSYMKIQSDLHMNQSRIANIRALTLMRAKDDNSINIVSNNDQLITFFQEVSRNELSAGKFYLSNDQKNYKFINTSLKKIYDLYLNALDNELISDQVILELGYTRADLEAGAFYSEYLDENLETIYLNKFEINGFNATKLVFSGQNLIVLILLIVLMLSDIYLKDLLEGGYKLIYSLQIDRRKLLLSKLIVALVILVILILYVTLTVFLVSSVIGGYGDPEYPIVSTSINQFYLSSNEMSFQVTPIWLYILIGFIQIVLVCSTLVYLMILVSISIKSLSVVMGASLGILFFTFFINSMMPASSIWRAIFPFSYIYVENLLNVNSISNLTIGFLINLTLTSLFIGAPLTYISRIDIGD